MNIDIDFLIEKLKESEYSEEQIDLIIKGLLEEKMTTFRINKLKCNDKEKLLKVFDDLGLKYTSCKSIKDAYILSNKEYKDLVKMDKSLRDFFNPPTQRLSFILKEFDKSR